MKQAAVLAMAIVVAGCASPAPHHTRSDDLIITIDAEGTFLVAVPLPLDEVTTLDTWQKVIDEKAVSLGNATLAVAASDRGPALWIEGNGFVVLELRRDATLSCCSDAFTERTWSVPASAGLQVHVAEGVLLNLRIDHEATSCQGEDCRANDLARNQYCSLVFRAQGPAASGWSDLPVRDDDWQCTPAP